MRRSDTLLFTSRETNGHENDTVQLTVRAGLVRQFGSGLYGFTPTGERIREKLIAHVDREMRAIGAQKISLPAMNDDDLWKRSGRWASFEGEMFTFENRDGKQLCLAPSHEEGVVHLAEGVVRSYEDLPLLVYQVGTKYRDDHARNGLVRLKEFTMKDAYSLHATRGSLDEYYDRIRAAYSHIFETLGIEFAIVTAENEVMGGSASEEFVALAETGTVSLRSCVADDCRFGVTDESPRAELSGGDDCPDCGAELVAGEGIEIGHVFKLGTRYSESMGLTVDLADGSEREVLMGSYGIGIERLVHTLVEQHGDESGCRWPGTRVVAPYTVSIIPLEYEGELQAVADRLYRECGQADTLLFDAEDQTIGERFAESDLLGVPWKVIVGNHFRETGEVELERRDGTSQYADVESVAQLIDAENGAD